MSVALVAAVALGGAAGAVLRWWLGRWNGADARGWPWGTLAANLLGSLALGVLVAHDPLRLAVDPSVLQVGLATGVLGGLTTFSTVMGQTALHTARRGLYLGVTVAGGLLAAWAGLQLG